MYDGSWMENRAMKRIFIVTGSIMAVLAVIGAQLWFTKYKYDDCRRVGHQQFYCVMDMFGS